MLIEEISKKLNISKDTLRYYEKIGLVDSVSRTSGGIRDYSNENYKRLEFICLMKKSGMSLKSLKEYIDLIPKGNNSIEMRRKILLKQQDALQSELNTIEQALGYLSYKIENYDTILANKKV